MKFTSDLFFRHILRPFLFFTGLMVVALLWLGCAKEGIYHSVKKGETLYRIGKTYDVDPDYLARANGIFFARNLQAGQRLFIPGADKARRVIPYAEEQKVSKKIITRKPHLSVSKKKKQPTKPTVVAKKPSAKKVSKTKKTSNVTARKTNFSWPVKGRVLRPFNPKGKFPCRGVEISASSGTPVRSAGAGRVIYSGNGIRGYGNLLILEHEDSFFTVYGFNQKNLVQTGAFVGDGEKIALTGSPPDGRSPRLHFEVRRGNEAVNPRIFLP
jgi:lipoprotein YgeR